MHITAKLGSYKRGNIEYCYIHPYYEIKYLFKLSNFYKFIQNSSIFLVLVGKVKLH